MRFSFVTLALLGALGAGCGSTPKESAVASQSSLESSELFLDLPSDASVESATLVCGDCSEAIDLSGGSIAIFHDLSDCTVLVHGLSVGGRSYVRTDRKVGDAFAFDDVDPKGDDDDTTLVTVSQVYVPLGSSGDGCGGPCTLGRLNVRIVYSELLGETITVRPPPPVETPHCDLKLTYRCECHRPIVQIELSECNMSRSRKIELGYVFPAPRVLSQVDARALIDAADLSFTPKAQAMFIVSLTPEESEAFLRLRPKALKVAARFAGSAKASVWSLRLDLGRRGPHQGTYQGTHQSPYQGGLCD